MIAFVDNILRDFTDFFYAHITVLRRLNFPDTVNFGRFRDNVDLYRSHAVISRAPYVMNKAVSCGAQVVVDVVQTIDDRI